MKRSDGAVFLMLAVISVSLILVDSYTPFHALRRGVSSLTYPTRKFFGFFSELVAANRRVEELSQIVMKLVLENARLCEYRWENERLREIVEFEKEGYYDLTAAEVTGREILPPVTYLTVNKGRMDAVEVGMPVCKRDGLVGKVMKVHIHSSLVQTLHDRNCLVSCVVEPSREVGILKSRGGRGLYLTGIPFDTQISEGYEVLSSGLGGIFPKGLRIGRVESVSPGHLGLFSMVKIVPCLNFSRVSEVFIITRRKEVKLLPPREEKIIKEMVPAPPPEVIPEFINEISPSKER